MSTITPPYRIETERLVLRCWDPADAAALNTAVDKSLEHLKPWMPWAKEGPISLDKRIELLRSFRVRFDSDADYIYGIWNREETEVLGGTGLHTRRGPEAFEIGYWTSVDHVRQGYAREASIAATVIGFEYCKKDRMEIRCDVSNEASAAIPKRLGFTLEAVRRRIDAGIEEGERRDTMIWTMLRSEYETWPHRGSLVRAAYDAAGRKIMG